VTADLRRFFESFNRLDAAAIGRHFWVPSMITTRHGHAVWADAGEVDANMVALCDRYRAGGASCSAPRMRRIASTADGACEGGRSWH
jgi:hypothetical protein